MKPKALKIYHLENNRFVAKHVKAALEAEETLPVSFEVLSVPRADQLKKMIEKERPDILLLDIGLGKDQPSGLEVAAHYRDQLPEQTSILYTSYDDEKTILEGFSAGCDQFISKTVKPNHLAQMVYNSHWVAQLKKGLISPDARSNHSSQTNTPSFVGRTLTAVASQISNLVASQVEIIRIEGEAGTGKQLVAQTLKSFLPANTPFIHVNCEEIPPGLFEETFFGQKGKKFEGTPSQIGFFEQAHQGWLYLQEIQHLSLPAQETLLGVIENKFFHRKSDSLGIQADFKLLSSSTQSLADLVRHGKFREDLWNRIQESVIELPSIKQRGTDEVREILDHLAKTIAGGPYQISPELLKILCYYDWTDGNVSEMKDTLISMSKYTNKSLVLTLQMLPKSLWEKIEPSGKIRGPSFFIPKREEFKKSSPSPAILIDFDQSSTFDEMCIDLFSKTIQRLQNQKAGKKLKINEISAALGLGRNVVSRMLQKSSSRQNKEGI